MSPRRPEYYVWAAAIQRCRNPNNVAYPRYGGRGIKVCDRWSQFENFLADMGERPAGMTLDRRDNNGDYEPDNCRWVDAVAQQRNTQKNVHATIDGETKTIAEWCDLTGLSRSTVYKRINRSGWSPEKAVTTLDLWRR